ncbi:MAG: tRNA (adenosine(37)-N6)-threonylcarbamoyltransferase complex dimerization subunit type 1 TsaB [Cyanobium sp.]
MSGSTDRVDGVAGIDSSGWLLALHSSSEDFAVGLLAWPPASGSAEAQARLACFDTGRALSNRLLSCVESVLPAAEWPRLRRLAVATGPGGFTGTRLSVVLARTLAQQADLPLDGVSSFQLIAQRLNARVPAPEAPFWLVQELPRRGLVAGLYGPDPDRPGCIAELEAPRLRQPGDSLAGVVLPAEPSLPEDVHQLLAVCAGRARLGLPAPWQVVVPLYPTSPVPVT